MRDWNLLGKALARTRRVVVNNELAHHASQMGLVDDQQLVQTLSRTVLTQRSAKALAFGAR